MPTEAQQLGDWEHDLDARHAALRACRERTNKAAQRFIRSVVVIDNDAYMGEKPPNVGNPLDVGKVTKAFALQGINCSVYRPEPEDEDIVDTCHKLLKQADVAIIDWHLGPNNDASLCKDAVAKLLSNDAVNGAAVRLIIVYTAEEPAALVDELQQHLSEFGLYPLPDATGYGLQNAQRRILILKKSDENNEDKLIGLLPEVQHHSAKASDLPSHVIEAFSDLVDGFVPSIALNAISAIRERSHELLGVFNKGLDGAFLIHSMLIPNMADARSFMTRLISDESYQIIRNDTHDSSDVSHDICKNYLIKDFKEFIFTCPACKGLGVEEKECKLCNGKDKECIICCGSNIVYELCQSCNGKKNWHITSEFILNYLRDPKNFDTISEKHILDAFISGFEETHMLGNTDFCRLTYLSSEYETNIRQYTNVNTPKLQQGTIIVHNKKPYICIIPPCDAVRIDGNKRIFPLLECTFKSTYDGASYVAMWKNKVKYISTPRSISWKKIKVETFSDNDVVLAKKNQIEDNYYFSSTPINGVEENYTWIGELRSQYATKLASECIPFLGRIGVNEYEWIRRVKHQCKLA